MTSEPRYTAPSVRQTFTDGSDQWSEPEERPEARDMLDRVTNRYAVLVCSNVKRGRPTIAAFIWADDDGRPHSVATAAPSRGRTAHLLGVDLTLICRCGLTHVVDGGSLRSAALALPRRRPGSTGKAPVIHMRDVERSAV